VATPGDGEGEAVDRPKACSVRHLPQGWKIEWRDGYWSSALAEPVAPERECEVRGKKRAGGRLARSRPPVVL